jgi:hypothetical protein
MNKLFLFEPELKKARGHHLDHLIETSIFFKKKKIIWITNKNFKHKKYFIPSNVKVLKKINTDSTSVDSKYSLLKNFFLLINLFIKNIYYLIKFLFNNNKNFFIAFKLNNYLLPKYFDTFYKSINNFKFSKYDNLIVQSARIKDIELFSFCAIFLPNLPKIHFKILVMHKKNKIIKIFKIIKFLKKLNFLNKKIYFYVENHNQKKEFYKNKIKNISVFKGVYSFSTKSDVKRKHILGFLGDSRKDKGFEKLPNLISSLSKSELNFNYYIQITNLEEELEGTKKELVYMAKNSNKINIFYNYLDFFEYRKLLKKITIYPILHDTNRIANVASGIFFSCITNEIPMILPRYSKNLTKFLKFNSFLKAHNIDSYKNKIIKIAENYSYYLVEVKKESKNYKQQLLKNDLIKNINKS